MSLQESNTSKQSKDTDINNILKPSEPWIETLSWKPRISVYNNILSEEDCDHIITKYGGTLKESGVLDFQGVFLVQSEVNEDPVLMELTKKIAEWTQIHVDFGETFYLWKFKEGDAYPVHKDVIDTSRLGDAGQRIASVFVYLNTPKGGELVFPDSSPEPVEIQPTKGSAVLLWNLKPNGEEEPAAVHTTKAILEGNKWTLTKWIRQKKFQN